MEGNSGGRKSERGKRKAEIGKKRVGLEIEGTSGSLSSQRS
jgi:hypothetical protein